MFCEIEITIGTALAGRHGGISHRGLADCFCDAANAHSALTGQSIYTNPEVQVSWVLMGWVIECCRRPVVGERVKIRTWMRNANRATSDRDFLMLDSEGEILARATSRWMGLDLTRGALVRLTPELCEPYQAETGSFALENPVFPDANRFSGDTVNRAELTAMRGMIDGFGHVHNTAYLDMALEALPEDIAYTPFSHIEVSYKKEIKPGGRVYCDYIPKDGRHYVAIRDAADERLHALIALY